MSCCILTNLLNLKPLDLDLSKDMEAAPRGMGQNQIMQ